MDNHTVIDIQRAIEFHREMRNQYCKMKRTRDPNTPYNELEAGMCMAYDESRFRLEGILTFCVGTPVVVALANFSKEGENDGR